MNKIDDLLPIKTDRLIIDKTTTKDTNFLLKIDKQEKTQQYLGGIKEISKEERILFLKKKENKWNLDESYPFTIFLKQIPIGFVELKITEKQIAELSFIFDSDYWKNGYCLEACQKIIQIAFQKLKFQKVIASAHPTNENSIKILEKLGFIENQKLSNNSFLCYTLFPKK